MLYGPIRVNGLGTLPADEGRCSIGPGPVHHFCVTSQPNCRARFRNLARLMDRGVARTSASWVSESVGLTAPFS